jgi:hypothetical protein
MSLLSKVVAHLAVRRVAFAAVGGTALAVRGVARSTFDVDLLTMDTAVLAEAFWAVVERDNAAIEVRRGDADDPLKGLVRLTSRDERPVDVVVGRGAWQEGVVKRAESFALLDVLIPVVGASDLVLLKLHAGGTQDLWDVKQLLDTDRDGEIARGVQSRIAEVPRGAAIAWKRMREG